MHLHRTLPGWFVLVTAVILVATASQSAVGQLTGLGRCTADVAAPRPIRKQPLARDYIPNQPMPESEQVVRQRLRKTISSNYQEMPLKDVLADLAARLELQILVDELALSDVVIGIDKPITLNVADISGAATLALVLEPLGLDWVEQDGVVTVTTIELIEEGMASRIYEVSDLVLTRDAEGHVVADFDELINAIVSCAEGRWYEEGLSGEIGCFETETTNVLMIGNDFGVFPSIDTMLADIRLIRASEEVVRRPPLTPRLMEIEERLTRKVNVDFDKTRLVDVMNSLGQQIDVPVLIDEQALSDVAIPIDEPISLRLNDVPAATAFELILTPLGLSQVIRHEVIQVSIVENLDELLETRVYDVRDLVAYTSRSAETELKPEPLITLLSSHAQGSWSNLVGSGGEAVCLKTSGTPVLIVRQTQRTHREVERIINELRALQMPRQQPAATSTIDQN